MEIHVARNGEKFGPYSPDEVRTRLTTGQLTATDLAWYEGLAQWMPLAGVMGGLPPGTVPPPLAPIAPATSGLARASFIIGILTSIVWFLIWGFIIATRVGRPQDPREDPMKIIAGLMLLLNIAGNLVGFILGVIVVAKPIPNRWMAIVGMALNGLAPIAIFFLMAVVLALVRQHQPQ